MHCERCFKLISQGEHGLGLCPFERRPANSVIADDIPGGVLMEHGLCDPDTAEPVRYYSKSEIAKEAKRRGLTQFVRHRGERGSDKSPHTVRWV